MTNSGVAKKRILFVEDDESLHGLVTLSLTGYRIVTACDFTEGLRLARQRYFDLYIFISPNQVLPTLLSGRLRAEEKALRAKANLAFLAAKGTRGDFARLWPSVYLREVRDRRNEI